MESHEIVLVLHAKVRIAAFVEGLSLIILLFVAVPLKRLAEIDAATMIVGPIHGVFLVVYLVLLIETVSVGIMSARVFLLAVVVAPIPFGTLFIERMILARLRREID